MYKNNKLFEAVGSPWLPRVFLHFVLFLFPDVTLTLINHVLLLRVTSGFSRALLLSLSLWSLYRCPSSGSISTSAILSRAPQNE